MKKWVSLFLAVAMLFALSLPVFAAKSEAQEAAQTLHDLGLFKGTGTDVSGNPIFDLNRAPTRAEAVTMLVRLLGKEDEALAGDWNTPFTDVADWAKPYVGYAYANGLTAGVSQTRFGSESSVTAAQFLTFVLRALGYESGKDFSWDSAWTLTDTLGMTSGQYNAKTNGSFLRADAALVSVFALSTVGKAGKTLYETIFSAKLPQTLSGHHRPPCGQNAEARHLARQGGLWNIPRHAAFAGSSRQAAVFSGRDPPDAGLLAR